MLNEKEIMERGKLASLAEPYINLLVDEITDEIMEHISQSKPDMEHARFKVLARNVLLNKFKQDTSRAADLAKSKTEERK